MDKGQKQKQNQYGRKTWDVAEYARIHKARKRGKNNDGEMQGDDAHTIAKRRAQKDTVQSIIGNSGLNDGEDTRFEFGEANSWFTCRVCNRRFKDSLKLSEHFASKMHMMKLKEIGAEEDTQCEKEITVENVRKHLEELSKRRV